MKTIVTINGAHLLAPTVETATQLVKLLGRCQTMVQNWKARTHETTYHPAEADEFDGRFHVSMEIVADHQVLARIPKSRRIAAPTPPAAATQDGPPQEDNP